jgi:hypothetical protein
MVDNIKNRLIAMSKQMQTLQAVEGYEGLFVKYLNSGELMELREVEEDAFKACVILACDAAGNRIFDKPEEVSSLDRAIVKAIVDEGVKLNVAPHADLKN